MSLVDWLAGGASVATIGTAAFGVSRIVQRRRKERPTKHVPKNLEFVPIRFEVYVGIGSVPEVRVTLRAINYLKRRMRVSGVAVRFLQLSGGPTIDDIGCPDTYEVPPGDSIEVYCRRKLLDSEADLVRAAAMRSGIDQGTLMFRGIGTIARRQFDFEDMNRAVFGAIQGLPRSAR